MTEEDVFQLSLEDEEEERHSMCNGPAATGSTLQSKASKARVSLERCRRQVLILKQGRGIPGASICIMMCSYLQLKNLQQDN